MKNIFKIISILCLGIFALTGCKSKEQTEQTAAKSSAPAAQTVQVSKEVNTNSLQEIMKARNLTEKDILAAAKTYQPSGRHDEFIVFSSGG